MNPNSIKDKIQSELDTVCDSIYELQKKKHELEKELEKFADKTFQDILNFYLNLIGKYVKSEGSDFCDYMNITDVKHEDGDINVYGFGYKIDNKDNFTCDDFSFCIYGSRYALDEHIDELKSYTEITKEEFESKLKETLPNWLKKHNMYGKE
jgi:hypothetical protein